MGGLDALNVTLAGIESLPSAGMEMRMAVKLRVLNPSDTPFDFDCSEAWLTRATNVACSRATVSWSMR